MNLGEVERRQHQLVTPCTAKMVARLLEQVRGLQQRLGGDAANVEAGAAKGGGASRPPPPKPKQREADSRDIAAWDGTEHDEVKGFVFHKSPWMATATAVIPSVRQEECTWRSLATLGMTGCSSSTIVRPTPRAAGVGIFYAFLDTHQEQRASPPSMIGGRSDGEVHHRPALISPPPPSGVPGSCACRGWRFAADRGWSRHQRAENAAVGDRERAACQVVDRRVPRAPSAKSAMAFSNRRSELVSALRRTGTAGPCSESTATPMS